MESATMKVLKIQNRNIERPNSEMMKSATKRHRSENWLDQDKELLKDLVKKRVKEIENKNTDTNTNQTKKNAWLDLQTDFNSLCSSGKRTLGQLKSQWTTLKILAKKEVSEHRIKSLQTGGGPPPPEVQISNSGISVWLPNEFVIDNNDYDSDIVVINGQESISTKKDTIIEIVEEVQVSNEKRLEIQLSNENNLQEERKADDIKRKRKKSCTEKRIEVDKSISEIAQTDVECRKELHLLQVEAEKKRIRNLDAEFELIQARLMFYKKKSFDMYNAEF